MVSLLVLYAEQAKNADFSRLILTLCIVLSGLVVSALIQTNTVEYLNAYMNGAALLIIPV